MLVYLVKADQHAQIVNVCEKHMILADEKDSHETVNPPEKPSYLVNSGISALLVRQSGKLPRRDGTGSQACLLPAS